MLKGCRCTGATEQKREPRAYRPISLCQTEPCDMVWAAVDIRATVMGHNSEQTNKKISCVVALFQLNSLVKCDRGCQFIWDAVTMMKNQISVDLVQHDEISNPFSTVPVLMLYPGGHNSDQARLEVLLENKQ